MTLLEYFLSFYENIFSDKKAVSRYLFCAKEKKNSFSRSKCSLKTPVLFYTGLKANVIGTKSNQSLDGLLVVLLPLKTHV